MRLRLGPTKFGADEYYFYRLFEDFTDSEKLEFIGWRIAKDIDITLNEDEWRVYANNKLKFDLAMSEAQLRVPELLAIYQSGLQSIPGVRLLASKEDVYQFLSNQSI